MWNVYIVRCSDGSYYTGIAKDVSRRIDEHNTNDSVGSKYTRSRRPVRLVYEEVAKTINHALRREREIKKLSREKKTHLISGA